MHNNRQGVDNTAVGYAALFSELCGKSNSVLGYRAAEFTKSDNNTAVGANALNTNQKGSCNTAMGSNSLEKVTGSYNEIGRASCRERV